MRYEIICSSFLAPTKLGFKGAKHIVAIFVTNDYPGGYWDDQGYNWFSGS
jgi:DMSO/TMAO reductase YedYZ molybdopterin-dependent catalytic subunit